MNERKITEATRRYIGGMLTNCNEEDVTTNISRLAGRVGLSRLTLTRWTRDARKMWWLTRHITDAELSRYHGRRPYTGDSRQFDHAQERCQEVLKIRADAAAGVFGEKWQAEERERKRTENGTPRAARKA